MAVSKTQIIRRVLEILGVVGTGQSISAEEYKCVLDTLEAVVASLEKRNLISFSAALSADEFPEEYALPFAAIIARHSAPSFGFGGQELAALKMMSDEAEADILATFQTERGVEPMAPHYF